MKPINNEKNFSNYIFSFCVITSSNAEDLKEFELSGMSIYSSLLDYFDKNEIKKILFIQKVQT